MIVRAARRKAESRSGTGADDRHHRGPSPPPPPLYGAAGARSRSSGETGGESGGCSKRREGGVRDRNRGWAGCFAGKRLLIKTEQKENGHNKIMLGPPPGIPIPRSERNRPQI
ncbi:hypothetical protein CGRA01v4_07729 [Colletotrichum graminicola]|nr:hypothetical protein CGRA01v4_07729 [Colletotrichum graminicola]